MSVQQNEDGSHTLIRRRAAAEYIRTKFGVPCAPSTLAKLAVIGGGPRYTRFSRYPMYSASDLDAWVQSRLRGDYELTSDY